MTLPAFAAERRAAAPGCGAAAAGAVDRYLCAYGAQQQTSRTPLRLTDRPD